MALRVKICEHALVNGLCSGHSQYVTGLIISSHKICSNYSHRRYSTDVKQDDVTTSDSSDEADTLRDVSRLPQTLYDRLGHVMRPPVVGVNREDDRWKFYPRKDFNRFQRKLFAKYGYDSGVDPGVMWPSKEQLREIIEEERETEPSLQELWARMKEEREAREKWIMEKDKKIEENLAKMPALLEAYKKRLQQQGQEKLAAQAKQKQLLDEARDYFGYKLARNDPRLKELKQKKMEEERLARRQKTREEKERLQLERAQAKAADLRAKLELKEVASKPEADEETEEEKDK